MQFGIQNTVIPPAPSVNTTDYNTIAIVGIAPKGPTQALTLCGSDTDDSQFGKCLTGFSIPRALSDIRSTGAGKVVVVNVFDKDAHTAAVALENATVTAQKAATAYDPIEITQVAATATQTITTGAGTGDTLQTLKVGTVDLLAGPILFTSGSATATALQIINAINAYTATSGFSAAAGSAGTYVITAPVSNGADLNGTAPTVGATTGTIVHATAVAFTGGINSLILVQNTPVSAVSATAATAALAVTTANSSAGDTLASMKVGLVELFASSLTITATTVANVRGEIVAKINANTGTSGFSATSGSGGAFTITGPSASGATLNGVITTIGTITGLLAIGTNGAFSGGVTAVTAVAAHTYIQGTDYNVDEYGNLDLLTAIADGKVLRLTYRKLDASTIDATAIIGTVSGSTRTGCKLIDTCQNTLGLVPKIFIIPTYNQETTVQAEMERLNAAYRMRSFYTTATGVTLAQAKTSRTTPGSTVPTFNTSTKRGIPFFNKLKTYDPKSGEATLTDPSAVLAGHLSYSAAVNGPQTSTSNTSISAVLGTEIDLLHKWEDSSSAADTNQLRNAGIACVFSDSGYKWWGAENASFPSNTAVDGNICVIYVNDVLTDSLTAFAKQYVDKNITNGSIDAAVTAMNDYYSTRMTAGWIGKQSKVSFKKERNPDADLQAGKVKFTRNTFYYVGMKLIELEENMEVQLPTV